MNKDDLIIVNINDIEDIVLAKYKIDQADPNVDGRSDLQIFVNTYCKITDIAILNDEIMPFKLISKFNMNFLFISDPNHQEKILMLLEKCKYNLNSLTEVNPIQMIDPDYSKNNIMLIRNNKYYNI